ncbi:MAG TPA: hypothetical protein VGC34_16635, partial [Steroidobacteraceae bacterium]
TLPALFARAPQLTPVRPQIEEFFQQSSLLFFGSATVNGGPASTPAPAAASSLPHALCAELRRIERRHES